MNAITLPAHFDGRQIQLDEPFEMEPDTNLMVTVLPKQQEEEERRDWLFLSQQGLQGVYGEDEPEYPLTMLRAPQKITEDTERLSHRLSA